MFCKKIKLICDNSVSQKHKRKIVCKNVLLIINNRGISITNLEHDHIYYTAINSIQYVKMKLPKSNKRLMERSK